MDTTVEFLSTVKQHPGFISSSIHKSTDGNKFANYAQWRSLEIYQAFVNNSDMQAKGAKLSEFDKPDSHVYEVVISESKFGRLEISEGGYIAHLAKFWMQPKKQLRVELVKEIALF